MCGKAIADAYSSFLVAFELRGNYSGRVVVHPLWPLRESLVLSKRSNCGAVPNLSLPRVLVTSEDVQRGKPDPKGFLLAAERLGVRIQQCLVFEDSAARAAAAKSSGTHVAIVGGHVPESEGDFALPNYL